MSAMLELAPPPEAAATPEALTEQVVSIAKRLEDSGDTLRTGFRETVGVQTTPLQETNRVPMSGHRLLLKDETVHPGGAYKLRGMSTALLVAEEQNPNVHGAHTGSAGNAALGLAEAANKLGLESTAHVRSAASSAKKHELHACGAWVDDSYDSLSSALAGAERMAAKDEDAVFVHPYNQVEVMAGQATIMQETLGQLAEQGYDLLQEEVDIVVPGGGLGLAAGSAAWLAEQRALGNVGPGVRLTITEIVRETSDGKLDKSQLSWCDGTATADGDKTRAILDYFADQVNFVEVTETEVAQAMHELTGVYNKRIEPAGALATAGVKRLAAEHPKTRFSQSSGVTYAPVRTYVAVVSGANVSDETYARASELRRQTYEQTRQSLAMLATGRTFLPPTAGRISRNLRVASGK